MNSPLSRNSGPAESKRPGWNNMKMSREKSPANHVCGTNFTNGNTVHLILCSLSFV